MKPLVIYHGNCFDGFTASWVIGAFLYWNCDFHAATYGEEPPIALARGRQVYVVDFSYPRDAMRELMLASTRTTVLDHHKTAEAALDGLERELLLEAGVEHVVVFDMNRSGAGIAWDYMLERDQRLGLTCSDCGGAGHYPGCRWTVRPWLVNYVEDRDLWRQALPHSREVSAYIASLPMTQTEWARLNQMPLSEAITAGVSVQRYIDVYGSKAREMARFEEIAGHRVPTVNLPYMNCSEHVGGLAEQYPDAPFACGYFRRADGRWQFSLRARGDFDVSEVAKLFGGGGHRAAAGFDVAVLPWEAAR